MSDIEDRFIHALIYTTNGDPIAAAVIAGYNDPQSGLKVAKKLKHQIAEASELALILKTPEAIAALAAVLVDPTIPGTKERISAAKEILDRAGLVGTQKVSVSAPSGLFVLPAKDYGHDAA
ncbi:MAG TPA: hypothetical protein VKQ29_04745 [Aliidongia sp.]|nr:hypothetical protein [Aliidongia sp.]